MKLLAKAVSLAVVTCLAMTGCAATTEETEDVFVTPPQNETVTIGRSAIEGLSTGEVLKLPLDRDYRFDATREPIDVARIHLAPTTDTVIPLVNLLKDVAETKHISVSELLRTEPFIVRAATLKDANVTMVRPRAHYCSRSFPIVYVTDNGSIDVMERIIYWQCPFRCC